MASPIIDFLLTRSSAPIPELKAPAPSDEEIATMIEDRKPRAGSRAAGALALHPLSRQGARGDRREAGGAGRKARRAAARRPQAKELARFSRAPLVIGVISSPKDNPKIPQWEMFLSGGMAAMNLMIAANALGYGANWITNWYSDVEEGRALLGLAPQERVVGFVHIGNYEGPAPERPRPESGSCIPTIRGHGTAEWSASHRDRFRVACQTCAAGSTFLWISLAVHTRKAMPFIQTHSKRAAWAMRWHIDFGSRGRRRHEETKLVGYPAALRVRQEHGRRSDRADRLACRRFPADHHRRRRFPCSDPHRAGGRRAADLLRSVLGIADAHARFRHDGRRHRLGLPPRHAVCHARRHLRRVGPHRRAQRRRRQQAR